MRKIQVGYYSKNHQIEKRPVPTIRQDMVKPAPTTKRKFNWMRVFWILFVVVVIAIGFFGYTKLDALKAQVIKNSDQDGDGQTSCTNILDPVCWSDTFRPKLKQDDGFTNMLILGVDTRSGGSTLKNTDTMIIASFNHKTQKTMLISIPRDFYVYEYHTKINAVYAFTAAKGKKEKNDEFYYVKDMVSKIIGKPIHYVTLVRLQGVVDVVNDVGGIEVCPGDAVTAMYPNPAATPTRGPQWIYFDFAKGCQQIDGEKALVYARFRHIKKGASYFASDFSRARRQQEVIEAVKNKLLSDDKSLTDRAQSIWSLLQSVNQNVQYDVSLNDILAGMYYLDTADRDPINIVLDPNFGGVNKYIFNNSSPANGYIIQAKDLTYKSIQREFDDIWKYPDFNRDNPNILVRNQTGEKALAADHPALKLKTDSKYYSAFNVLNDSKSTKVTGIQVFDFTGGKKNGSLQFILDYLGLKEATADPTKYGIVQSSKHEDFVIVVGPATIPTPTASPTN